MPMSDGQMQWNIIAHIGGIDSGTALQQHLNQFCVTFFGQPMQWAESMIITSIQNQKQN